MESWHIVFFDDAEAVIDITFPDFRRDGWTVNRTFLDFFHTEIGHYRANWTAHSASVYLFIDSVIEHKIVVWQGKLEEWYYVIDVQICSGWKRGILFQFDLDVITCFVNRDRGEQWYNIEGNQDFVLVDLDVSYFFGKLQGIGNRVSVTILKWR